MLDAGCAIVHAGWRPSVRLPRLLLLSLFLLISVTRFRARFFLFRRVINDSIVITVYSGASKRDHIVYYLLHLSSLPSNAGSYVQ